MQKPKIPITVIQGFLGSGKTTLLNYILTHNHDLNIGVVVNDFGDINIDSKLIKTKTDKQLELTSGCICCSLQTLDIQQAIDQFTYPGSGIDYILIEASGLAEPRDLAMTLHETIGIKVRLDSIVTVLDAENITKNAQQHETARDQIIFADFIVINKIDLVTEQDINEIKKLITSFNPRARIFSAKNAEIDIRLLLDQDTYKVKSKKLTKSNATSSLSHDNHLHHRYTSLSWQTKKPLDPMKFQNFVNRQIPTNIYRAKGFVNLGTKGHLRRYVFHLVGIRAEITWDNWVNQEQKTQLVFIGQDINKEELKSNLEKCIDSTPNMPLPNGIELKLPKKSDS